MRLAAVITWVFIIIVTAALAVTPDVIEIRNDEDKMLHITVFCLLTLFPIYFLSRLRHMIITILTLALFGMMIEWVQALVPGRESSYDDMLANLGGIMIGVLVGYLLRPSARLPGF
jgi:VanZ family protein